MLSSLVPRRAERQACDILERPDVRAMLDQLIASGACANEAEATRASVADVGDSRHAVANRW